METEKIYLTDENTMNVLAESIKEVSGDQSSLTVQEMANYVYSLNALNSGTSLPGIVLYTPQDLTKTQQTQIRENIATISIEDYDLLEQRVTNLEKKVSLLIDQLNGLKDLGGLVFRTSTTPPTHNDNNVITFVKDIVG